jgi:type II secretory pathway component PulF
MRLAAHCVAGFCVAAVLLLIVPRAMHFFANMGVKLPAVTLQLGSASRFVSDYWYIVIPVTIAADAVLLYLLEIQRSKIAVRIWFVAILLLAITFLFWAALALVTALPIESLSQHDRQSNGPGGSLGSKRISVEYLG